MNQNKFEELIALLYKIKNNDLFKEVYTSLNNDKICLHDLGIFDIASVIDIVKDKISLEDLNLKEHNSIGLKILLRDLLLEEEKQIRQIEITNSYCGYVIFFSLQFERQIGLYKNIKQNYYKDIKYQQDLISLGHPNKNIYLFDKGKLLGSFFKNKNKF